MEEIKVGDIVWHKAGGHRWHVDAFIQDNNNITVAVCSRIQNGAKFEERFTPSSLTKDNPSAAQSVRIY
jgi:hypothetical protein